jgi:hypothetical protein
MSNSKYKIYVLSEYCLKNSKNIKLYLMMHVQKCLGVKSATFDIKKTGWIDGGPEG